MTHTATLRELADRAAALCPDLGRELHSLAGKFGPMEQLIDEMAEEARQAEYREMLLDSGIVVLPVGWGNA